MASVFLFVAWVIYVYGTQDTISVCISYDAYIYIYVFLHLFLCY